jgi:tRNA (guanine-N7-)-methyltransferase
VGKNKLLRWAELDTLDNVIQPGKGLTPGSNHPVRGKWKHEIFRNENPIVLELGCGKGEYALGLSEIFPEKNFIGVDIKGARMWRGAKTASERKSKNVAFLRTRIEFITCFFVSDEVDEIWITFPDPHPGKINSNKRLTCPWFLNTYRNFLKNNGIIHLKTDNTELYKYTRRLVTDNGLDLLFATNDLHSESGASLTALKKVYLNMKGPSSVYDFPEKILSIRTFYEEGFMKEGLAINYLAFRLDKNKAICHGWEKTEG